MAYQLNIRHRPNYLHVKVFGLTNLENALAIWKKVAQVSKRLCVRNVLCEGCLEIPGYEGSLYDYGKMISGADVLSGTRIAFICDEEKYRELSGTGTTMTTRFSVFPKIFSDVDEGIRWLTKEKAG